MFSFQNVSIGNKISPHKLGKKKEQDNGFDTGRK